uniref:Uncharacterized protein n=1 Tax=Sphaerodactylus townsendi TaxID=933632 RepID=A0ACB8G6W1_9SAUR
MATHTVLWLHDRGARLDSREKAGEETMPDEDPGLPRCGGCLSWVRVAMLVGVLVQIVAVVSLNVLERIGPKHEWQQEQKLGPDTIKGL